MGYTIVTGLSSALTVAWFLKQHQTAAFLAAEVAVVAFALWLSRVGPPHRPARLIAGSLPLLATALVLRSRMGLGDVAVLVYPACLVVAGLLLDRRALGALTALTVACVAVVTFGVIGNRADTLSTEAGVQYVINAAIILSVTAIGVSLVAGHLRRAFARLQRREADLRDAYRTQGDQAERLRVSESRFRELIDLAADAILVEDPSGHITHVNDRAGQLSGRGRQELLDWTIAALFAPLGPEGRSERGRPPSEGDTAVEERLLLHRDGTSVPVEASSKRMPDGSRQTILRDVSERKRAEAERSALEDRLHQSQKMAAIGRLAGGVAHDFNNLLTAITSSLTMALREVPETTRAHRWLKEVDAAAWRAAALTRQLLSFGQRGTVAPKDLDLRDVVRELQPVLIQLVGDRIHLDLHLPPEQCPVRVDQVQIERAVLNLAANARDAMAGGGTLRIEIGRTAEEEILEFHPAARPGPHVTLTVSDNGSGLSPHVREHLFEPFFTTKASSQGTGLGLAIVHAAVEQNKGFIDVASTPGRGAAFRLHFPLASESARSEASPDPDVVGRAG